MEISGRRQESTGQCSGGDNRIFCQPCLSDGDTELAIGYCQNCNEFMCTVCLKVHRKQTMSRNHTILDGDNMPKVSLQKVSLNACSDTCPKHVNEIIKYYCSSHDVVGCGDCMIIDHESCKTDRIQDIALEYFNSTEHQDIVKRVEQIARSLNNLKTDLQADERTTAKSCENAIRDIRTFKREIIEYLDRTEKEMIEIIAKRKQRDQSLLQKLKQGEKRLHDYIKEIQINLQLQQNQAYKLFVEAKQVRTKLCSIGGLIVELKEREQKATIVSYEFRRSSHISQIIDSGLMLGQMLIIKDDTENIRRPVVSYEECVSSSSGNNISKMDAYFDCEINMKLQDDASDCFISDCTLISRNQLAVVDHYNICIKIVNVKNKDVSKYKLRSDPFGIAVVNPTLIAVTLPDEDKIQFLSITAGNKIAERNMIKVEKRCYKITIYDDKIIGITLTSVEIMSMSGQKMKSISHLKMTMLMDIAVVPSSNEFYVSNCTYRHNSIYILKYDFDGNLIATYADKELVDVRGLEVTRDGILLVCNWDKDGNIHVITPDCKKIKVILKQNKFVSYPWCASFCNDTNKLFLANRYHLLDSKLQNVLKVFQLK